MSNSLLAKSKSAKRFSVTISNATVGFEKLAKVTGTPSKSLMGGNVSVPREILGANNLFAVIGKLQRVIGCSVLPLPAAAGSEQRREARKKGAGADPDRRI